MAPQAIEVSAQTLALQTESGEVRSEITSKSIENLPIPSSASCRRRGGGETFEIRARFRGRTRPEADFLRASTGRGINEHMEVLTATEAFPRAELGLPYLIKFRSRTGSRQDGANDCTIYPQDSERTASPVILKPFGVWGRAESGALGSVDVEIHAATRRQDQV